MPPDEQIDLVHRGQLLHRGRPFLRLHLIIDHDQLDLAAQKPAGLVDFLHGQFHGLGPLIAGDIGQGDNGSQLDGALSGSRGKRPQDQNENGNEDR